MCCQKFPFLKVVCMFHTSQIKWLSIQYLCGNLVHSVKEMLLWYILFSFSKRLVIFTISEGKGSSLNFKYFPTCFYVKMSVVIIWKHKCNIIQKLPNKVKFISQNSEGLIMFFRNWRIRFFKLVSLIVNNMEWINTRKRNTINIVFKVLR